MSRGVGPRKKGRKTRRVMFIRAEKKSIPHPAFPRVFVQHTVHSFDLKQS